MKTAPIIMQARGALLVLQLEKAIRWLESVPYSLLALPLRVAVAAVFWRSGMAKLANWETTLFLFEDEYKVPVLPPEIAANMTLAIEIAAPVLLVAGLFTRAVTVVLLAMTTVIQVFVYPGAWPTHIQWAAMLLVLLCRGAGSVSLDHFLTQRLLGTSRRE
jgi:putative oxidoreductase